MRQVKPEIYNKDYYLNFFLGSENFKTSKGTSLDKKWKKIPKL
jgi:hypothetical protein